MRVYGTSPLYNYVELIFRSKRLFLGSMIIATLATAFFYFYRAGTYTARTLVLLSGDLAANPDDKEERGTLQYKLNILSLDLKNPKFIRQALKDKDLGPHNDSARFEQYAKDVKDKLTYSVENNILEISCTWTDSSVDKIVDAIYYAYKGSVLAKMNEVSVSNEQMFADLLAEYTNKRNGVEKTVRDYEKNHMLDLEPDPGPASSQYQQAENELKRVQYEKDSAAARLQLMQAQLASTPRTIEESVVRSGTGKDPQFTTASAALEQAKNELLDLNAKYTPTHPKVKAAQEKVTALTKEVDKFTSPKSAPTKPGPILNQTQSTNPTWMSLDNQVKQEEINVQGLEKQVVQAQSNLETAKTRAINSPGAQYNYRRMTDKLALYTTFQTTFATQYETAKVNEVRDTATHSSEITQAVTPEPEKDNKGAKGLLMLAAGPLIGLIIAFSFSLLAESMDHSLRTPLEIEQHLGKPVLAVLPRINTGRESARRQIGGDASRPTLPS